MKSTWTLEKLKAEALKYQTRTEFVNKSNGAYQRAMRTGVLDQLCVHMEEKHCKPHTMESLLREAKKYKTITDLLNNNKSAYNAARRLGVLKEVCENFDKEYWKWTNEELLLEALKYDRRIYFQKGSHSAYVTAVNRGILQEICQHMKKAGDISRAQKELFESIKNIYPEVKQLKLRKIIIYKKPHIKGMDIDIYIPGLKKGIEFDGTYWHSFEGLKRSHISWPDEDVGLYHKIKDDYFRSIGIEILHIKEKDWIKNKQDCINLCLEFLSK